MEELGTIQDELTFMILHHRCKSRRGSKSTWTLDLGLERDVTDLSGGQRTESAPGKIIT